jgi:Raf kinase inhibitor-like YbhB/YbcL family protein
MSPRLLDRTALAGAVLALLVAGCTTAAGTLAPSASAPPSLVGVGPSAAASATPAPQSSGSGSDGRASPATNPSGATPPTEHSAAPSTEATPVPNQEPFQLSSPAFTDQTAIPVANTCKGRDVSPELDWSSVPAGTAALVLFVDDPDGRDWVHWSVLDLPPATMQLAEALAPDAAGIQQGRNDFGNVGYGGPCPPSGTHHYRFRLYALAAPLGLAGHPDGAAVRAALARARVLGLATLIGTVKA